MPSTATSRLEGTTTSVCIKAPVRVATTANITLLGLQTIDGIALAADNRVLVKDQTDASENGIYKASASDWYRTLDFDGTLDAVPGTLVFVHLGTAHGNQFWKTSGTSATPIVIGTDDIAFEPVLDFNEILIEMGGIRDDAEGFSVASSNSADDSQTSAEASAVSAGEALAGAGDALTSASNAATSETNAETAADIAALAAATAPNIYATIAAGNAAVADGETFFVQTAANAPVNLFRRVNATPPVAGDALYTFASRADLDAAVAEAEAAAGAVGAYVDPRFDILGLAPPLTEVIKQPPLLSEVTSPSGLADHASGGICAAVDGVAGTGTLPLGVSLDPARKWRVVVAIEYGGGSNTCTARLGKAGSATAFGVNVIVGPTGADATSGLQTLLNDQGADDAASGQVIYMSLASDGQGFITPSFFRDNFNPATVTNIVQPSAFSSTWDGFVPDYPISEDWRAGQASPIFGTSAATWIDSLIISMTSAASRIVSIYVAMDGYGGLSSAYTYGAPSVLYTPAESQMTRKNPANNSSLSPITTTYYATGGAIVLPKFTPDNDSPLAFFCHPNTFHSAFGGSKTSTMRYLFDNGYIIANPVGSYANAASNVNTMSDALGSNWGGISGQGYRYKFYDWIKQWIGFDKYCLYGESMGLLDALTFLADDRVPPFAIIGISGVTDIEASYVGANANLLVNINKGHGEFWLSLANGNTATPGSDPTKWKLIGSRIKMMDAVYRGEPFNYQYATWSAGTYALNDIVNVAWAGTQAGLRLRNPIQNPTRYLTTPAIYLRHGTADTTIIPAQASGFQTAVNNALGNVTYDAVSGGTHLSAGCYDVAAEVAFLEKWR